MSSDVLKLVLAAFTTFLGGGAVQLVIALVRRKSELRQVDTQSDVNTSTAAVNYSTATEMLITNLVADGERYRTLTETIQTTVERLQREAVESQREFARQLDVSHGENSRLAMRIAQLTTDLDIAHRQLADYTTRRPYTDPHTRET